MVDTMAVLGAAAAAKLTGDRLVRDFVAYIRETGSSVSSTAQAYAASSSSRKRSARRPRKARLSRPMKPSTSGLGRRPGSSRLSKKVSTMSDAELEAELDARRRRRAREREAYSRAMRSDKLAALESELDSLRREIGRLDQPAPGMMPRQPAGTPPNVRWEALPRSRRPPSAHGPSPPGFSLAAAPAAAASGGPQPPPMGGPPPPPPPPSMMGGFDDDDGLSIDPEKQRLEKLERQKRREAKKKEREQNQKKMTLADIIRAAGPDPVSRLKPASLKPADLEKQEWERAKRDREDREAKQEKERIENERLTKEGPKRATEQSPKKENEMEDEDEDKKKAEGEENGENDEAKEEAKDESKADDKDADKDNFTKPASGEAIQSNIDSKDNTNTEATGEAKSDAAGETKTPSSPGPATRSKEERNQSVNKKDQKAANTSSDQSPADLLPEKPVPTQTSDVEKSKPALVTPDANEAKDVENVTPNAPPKADFKPPAKLVEDASTSPVEGKVETSS